MRAPRRHSLFTGAAGFGRPPLFGSHAVTAGYTWPAVSDRVRPHLNHLRPRSAVSHRNKHVLCVHEDEDTCQTLLEPLRREGYDVMTTTILSTALYAASTRGFDLFVVDRLRLDDMCLELSRKLRGMHPGTPIFIYAGAPRGVEAAEVLAAGATRVVAKPHIQELISYVLNLN